MKAIFRWVQNRDPEPVFLTVYPKPETSTIQNVELQRLSVTQKSIENQDASTSCLKS